MRSHLLVRFLLVVPLAAAGLAGCVATATTGPARPAEAHAARNGFVYLGERSVDGGLDHDAIAVGRGDGRFREIMVVVERAPVEIYDLVVTFGDGQRFEPRTRMVFGRDTTSRNIDLPGGARVIRRVDFRYGNLVAGARAKVELWGR
jgi:hypothetical protein